MFLKDYPDCLLRETDGFCRNSLQLTLKHCAQLSHSTDREWIHSWNRRVCSVWWVQMPRLRICWKRIWKRVDKNHQESVGSQAFPLSNLLFTVCRKCSCDFLWGQGVLLNRFCNLCNVDPRKLIDSVLAERVKSAESRQSKSADSVAITWHLPGIYMHGMHWIAIDSRWFKACFDTC